MTFLEKFSRRLGVLEYLGTWDASTGNPPGTEQRGGYYVVSVSGTTNLDGENDWNPGDWAIYNGTAWQKIDSTDQVESVAGKQGAVSLEASDITDFSSAVQSEIFPKLIQTGVRYVSPSGNDLSASGGLAAPFQTIAAALVGAPSGTVIFLLPGVYSEPTPAIPSHVTVRGLSSGTTEIVNGLTHTAGSGDAVDVRIQAVNFNALTLNETSALNGLISIKESIGSITRSDSNSNVLIQMTESTLAGANISGGSSSFNECLVINSPTFTGGTSIFENSKFVARIEAEGAATVGTLDCILFGATEFVNGTIASAETPIWLTDLASEAVGGYTGDITKQLLAYLQSTDISDFEQAVDGVQLSAFVATKEPTGHADRTQSTVDFDEGTRTFSIAPVSSGFDIWIAGVKQTITTTLSVQIPNTSGNYFFYIDANGALQYQASFDLSLFEGKVYTGFVHWNATDGEAIVWGEERHGIVMDGATHSYLHTTRGTQLVSGGGVTYTIGNGSLDADAQIGIGDLRIRDEDIAVNIAHSATPANPFEQVLFPKAQVPILYREGTEWRRSAATDFPLIVGTDRAKFNEYTGTTWQLTEATANNKVLITYIFATTDFRTPIIGILGQAQYQNEDEAKSLGGWDQITFGDLPAQELKLLYILYYTTSSNLSNAAKSHLLSVSDARFTLDRQVSASSFNGDHSNLSGLSNDDHVQYLLTSGARSMTGDLNLGGNDIASVGTVNGVTVEAHASRHQPGGADPIPTAAAVSIATANAEGTSTSLARSDHTHKIDAGFVTNAMLAGSIDAIKIDGGLVSNAEFNTLDGITTGVSIQSQIDGKQATITGAATTITISDLTASRAVVSDTNGKVAVSAATSAEIGFLSGVTSSVQTQLDGKEPTISAGTTAQYWRGDKTFQTLNATAVVNTPSGNIASTTVQAALNELDTEKQPVGNYITALTGDVTASGPGSAAATLANSGVVAGTYSLVTVDAKGRVTVGSNTGSITRYTAFSSAAATNATVTYTTVGQLTTVSLPTGLYRFSFHGNMQSTQTTAGVGVRIAPVTATITTVSAKWNLSQGVDGVSHDFEFDQLTTATNVTSASVATANANFAVNGMGIFRVTVAGTVAIQIRTETAGQTATLQPDAALVVELV